MNNSESGEVILYVSEATLDDEVFLFNTNHSSYIYYET